MQVGRERVPRRRGIPGCTRRRGGESSRPLSQGIAAGT